MERAFLIFALILLGLWLIMFYLARRDERKKLEHEIKEKIEQKLNKLVNDMSTELDNEIQEIKNAYEKLHNTFG